MCRSSRTVVVNNTKTKTLKLHSATHALPAIVTAMGVLPTCLLKSRYKNLILSKFFNQLCRRKMSVTSRLTGGFEYLRHHHCLSYCMIKKGFNETPNFVYGQAC